LLLCVLLAELNCGHGLRVRPVLLGLRPWCFISYHFLRLMSHVKDDCWYILI
jgi:hypothetical protein